MTNRTPTAARRSAASNPTRTTAPAPRRRRWSWWTTVPTAAVVLSVVTLVALAPGPSPAPSASPLSVGAATGTGTSIGSGATPAPATVEHTIASLSAATLRTVGAPEDVVGPTRVTGDHAPLVGADGKPEVLYVGAEYCPYCAAERWALAVALARFGTFSGLETTHSSTTDVYPDTRTLSFYGSTYTSATLDFVPVELTTNQLVDNQYPTLQRLTGAQQSVLDAYDRAPYTSQPGAIPFIDVANRYVMIGAGYSPAVLQGASAAQIADAMTHPSSTIARAVDGSANLLVNAITRATGLAPNR
jgi:Domain of unknown function (DUF929)